jgi:hypothetical protein
MLATQEQEPNVGDEYYLTLTADRMRYLGRDGDYFLFGKFVKGSSWGVGDWRGRTPDQLLITGVNMTPDVASRTTSMAATYSHKSVPKSKWNSGERGFVDLLLKLEKEAKLQSNLS